MRLVRRLRAFLSLGGALVALAPPMQAGDGVIELNQACGAGAGCIPGDSAGFPIQITQGGSYRLTSDLSSGFANLIEVYAEVVTIDLNGFTVTGAGNANPNNRAAIWGGHRVTVRNGFVRFASNDGIQLGGSSRVDDIHVYGSERDGVRIAGEGTIRNVVATSNAGTGIGAGAASVIEGCTATANGGNGISLISGSVRGSTATQNTGAGGSFGGEVSFATNYFAANGGGDAVGGHAAGGNVCRDKSCTSDGKKRYYLTYDYSSAINARTHCAPGFHFAALPEILDPSALQYGGPPGTFIYTPESTPPLSQGGGPGPPPLAAWVRTSAFPSTDAVAGTGNCNRWTSSSATDFGTIARFSTTWPTAAGQASSWWVADVYACNLNLSVWCVED